MDAIFTTSTINFFCFLVAGSAIVYLILKFDKANRQKFNKVMLQAKDVQPMLMQKSAQRKLHTLKMAAQDKKIDRTLVEKQLDELVADYDKGHISLPDYCNKLNRLLAMTA
jgi:arginase family enzyme